jgi:hypothetical protein
MVAAPAEAHVQDDQIEDTGPEHAGQAAPLVPLPGSRDPAEGHSPTKCRRQHSLLDFDGEEVPRTPGRNVVATAESGSAGLEVRRSVEFPPPPYAFTVTHVPPASARARPERRKGGSSSRRARAESQATASATARQGSRTAQTLPTKTTAALPPLLLEPRARPKHAERREGQDENDSPAEQEQPAGHREVLHPVDPVRERWAGCGEREQAASATARRITNERRGLGILCTIGKPKAGRSDADSGRGRPTCCAG